MFFDDVEIMCTFIVVVYTVQRFILSWFNNFLGRDCCTCSYI